ncbi:ArnT family glycosyltransferase [Cerasicoccus maritimus]|uniref:ArnT family glycosyltransferase n=1 Tax=Cerasicoccus maritimus TaxID=490089 RepID=UPI00285282E4|nr:glycosyltransferase family 39 protein [Cerasicoccus maritimus]
MAAALLLTMGDYGMSWDEMTRWDSGDLKLQYFERLVGEGGSVWGSAGANDVYPGLFDLPLAAYAKYVGGDRVLAGHLYTIFFAVLAVCGAGLIGREVGGWRLAFWSSLFLALLPRFYGHAVFNPKDIPFAATYTWALWGVIQVARGMPDGKFRRWVGAGLLAGLAMSTRLPGMIVLAYLFGLLAYRFVSQSIPTDGRRWRPPPRSELLDGIGGYVVASVCALVLLLFVFPGSHVNPFASSAKVVSKLHDFSQSIPVLFRGQVYDAGTTPWYYLPWMLLMVTPVWQLLLLLVGVGFALRSIVAQYLRKVWWPADVLPLGVTCLGFAFPLLYILVTQPAIHNGVRHAMFVLPAGAVLMGYGLTQFMDWIGKTRRLGLIAGYVLVSGLVATNVFTLIQLHPYQYVYFNRLVGGPSAALGWYETEYWFTSMADGFRELEAWRREQGLPDEPVKVMVTGPLEIAEYQLPDGWVLTQSARDANYFLGNTQFAGHLLVEGEEIVVIGRMGLPILVVKKLPSLGPTN